MRIDRRKRDGGHVNPLAGIGKMDTTKGRFPANFIHDGSEEVMRLFPHTTSGKPCGIQNVKSSTCGQSQAGRPLTGFGDSGSAARFFYCAKASRSDREEGLESDSGTLQQSVEFGQRKHGTLPYTEEIREQNPRPRANIHPTVKPTDLMRYLCRLVTPPNGIVLDPFMGSGSTGKAAMLEGFRFIGIELNPEYAEIASKRIQAVVEVKTDEPNLGELFE
jgi:site-specific DNA-methyltransferase (adenine-specific)